MLCCSPLICVMGSQEGFPVPCPVRTCRPQLRVSVLLVPPGGLARRYSKRLSFSPQLTAAPARAPASLASPWTHGRPPPRVLRRGHRSPCSGAQEADRVSGPSWSSPRGRSSQERSGLTEQEAVWETTTAQLSRASHSGNSAFILLRPPPPHRESCGKPIVQLSTSTPPSQHQGCPGSPAMGGNRGLRPPPHGEASCLLSQLPTPRGAGRALRGGLAGSPGGCTSRSQAGRPLAPPGGSWLSHPVLSLPSTLHRARSVSRVVTLLVGCVPALVKRAPPGKGLLSLPCSTLQDRAT